MHQTEILYTSLFTDMISTQNRLYYHTMMAANFELNREITDKIFFFKTENRSFLMEFSPS